MKKFYVIFLFLVGACNPAGDARDACQQILDDTIPPIVQDIEDQCKLEADQAAEQCSMDISSAIDDIKAWAEQKLKDAEKEAFMRAGCVEDSSPLGWDCTASPLCH